jgi:hypothetical protein
MPYEPDPGDEAPRAGAACLPGQPRSPPHRHLGHHRAPQRPRGHVLAGPEFRLHRRHLDGRDFSFAEFSGGTVSFWHAEFPGGEVDFSGANFSGGTVSFHSAEFSGGTVRFSGARFSSGSSVDFSDAHDWSFPPAFSWTDTPPSGVKLPKLV